MARLVTVLLTAVAIGVGASPVARSDGKLSFSVDDLPFIFEVARTEGVTTEAPPSNFFFFDSAPRMVPDRKAVPTEVPDHNVPLTKAPQHDPTPTAAPQHDPAPTDGPENVEPTGEADDSISDGVAPIIFMDMDIAFAEADRKKIEPQHDPAPTDAPENVEPTAEADGVAPMMFIDMDIASAKADRKKTERLPKVPDENSGDGNWFYFPVDVGSPEHDTTTTAKPTNTTAPPEEPEGNADFAFPSPITQNSSPEETVEETAWSPGRNTGRNTGREGECLLEKGLALYNGSCKRLLARNTCGEGEWLVLVEDVPRCEQRPCPWGKVPFKGRCVLVDDLSVCDRGQILYVSMQGEAVCDCDNGYLYNSWDGNCYARHEKGSCNFGEYIDVSASGRVACVPSPCVGEFVKDPATERCYHKMYSGYCKKTLFFHSGNETAECLDLAFHNILDVPVMRDCPPGSVRDYLNVCRKVFLTPTSFSYPEMRGACPIGFIRDHLGLCRMISSLFG